MSSGPVVSVIVPVYNPGPYLRKCLDSVCGQTLRDVEILCVDDCSTDGSLALLEAYAAREPRITVIAHKKNRGCAAARNSAMDVARGTYIHFLDSDDWIDPGYLEELVHIAEEEHLPLLMNSNIIWEHEDGTSTQFDPGTYGETIGFSTTGYVEYGPNIGNFTYSSCCCLYRRDYLQKLGIRFPEGLDYTDNYFHMATFLPQEKIYITNGNAYHYVRHKDSICGRESQMMCKYDIFDVYHYIYAYYRENGFLDKCKLNFFTLSNHFPNFAHKEIAFEKLHRLFRLMEKDVQAHPEFYTEKEKNFFADVLRSPNYLYFEHLTSPHASKLRRHLAAARKTVVNSQKAAIVRRTLKEKLRVKN